MIKMKIWSLTIPYAKNKAKNVRTLEKQLESRIESLENKIEANPTMAPTLNNKNTSVSELNYAVSTRRGQTVLSFDQK